MAKQEAITSRTSESVPTISPIERKTIYGNTFLPEFSHLALQGRPLEVLPVHKSAILVRPKTAEEKKQEKIREQMTVQLNMASVYEGLQHSSNASERVLNFLSPLQQREFLVDAGRVQQEALVEIPLSARLNLRKQEVMEHYASEIPVDPQRKAIFEQNITRQILIEQVEEDKQRIHETAKTLSSKERMQYFKNFAKRIFNPTYEPLGDWKYKAPVSVGRVAASLSGLLFPELLFPKALSQLSQNPLLETLVGGIIPKIASLEKFVPGISHVVDFLSNRNNVFLGSLGLSAPLLYKTSRDAQNPSIEASFMTAINNRSVGRDGKDKLGFLVGLSLPVYLGVLALTSHLTIPLVAGYIVLRSIAGLRIGVQVAKWARRTNADALRDIADARKNPAKKPLKEGTISELLPSIEPSGILLIREKEKKLDERVKKLESKDRSITRFFRTQDAHIVQLASQEYDYKKLSREDLEKNFAKRTKIHEHWLTRFAESTDEYENTRKFTKQRKIARANFERIWTEMKRNQTEKNLFGQARNSLIPASSIDLFVTTVGHMISTHKNNEENLTVKDIATNPILVRNIKADDILWMTGDWLFPQLWPAIELERQAVIA